MLAYWYVPACAISYSQFCMMPLHHRLLPTHYAIKTQLLPLGLQVDTEEHPWAATAEDAALLQQQNPSCACLSCWRNYQTCKPTDITQHNSQQAIAAAADADTSSRQHIAQLDSGAPPSLLLQAQFSVAGSSVPAWFAHARAVHCRTIGTDHLTAVEKLAQLALTQGWDVPP